MGLIRMALNADPVPEVGGGIDMGSALPKTRYGLTPGGMGQAGLRGGWRGMARAGRGVVFHFVQDHETGVVALIPFWGSVLFSGWFRGAS